MSVTLDANVLIYASDTSSPLHAPARSLLDRVARGPDLVYVFWPVIMAYLRIVTHPRLFTDPLDPEDARANITSLLARPHIRVVGEGRRFWNVFEQVAGTVPLRGNLVPDAHVVSLMREHGVRTIWTRDRDFRKFDGIEAVDPFR